MLVPTSQEKMMRKMIFMAVAGFLWKKFQERGMKRSVAAPVRRSY